MAGWGQAAAPLPLSTGSAHTRPCEQAIPCAVGVGGFPPTAMPAPLTVPSPTRLGGGGSSSRSITAGEAHGVCPGSTARTAPQPWLAPDLCVVSPSNTLSPPVRSNKSFQLMLAKSGPPRYSTLWIPLPLEGFYFCAMPALSPQCSERQPLPSPSLAPLTASWEFEGPWDSRSFS